jgi:hypothetical protein
MSANHLESSTDNPLERLLSITPHAYVNIYTLRDAA